jgi:hypothetical protein
MDGNRETRICSSKNRGDLEARPPCICWRQREFACVFASECGIKTHAPPPHPESRHSNVLRYWNHSNALMQVKRLTHPSGGRLRVFLQDFPFLQNFTSLKAEPPPLDRRWTPDSLTGHLTHAFCGKSGELFGPPMRRKQCRRKGLTMAPSGSFREGSPQSFNTLREVNNPCEARPRSCC